MSAKIMIAEDEPLLAMAISEQLRDWGFEVAGIAASLRQATTLLTTVSCDAAILDCNLRGESIAPLAAQLRARKIPFLFHSGYNSKHIPPEFADAPFLSKPVSGDALQAAVRALLSNPLAPA